jgi:cellobiose phosphorylase
LGKGGVVANPGAMRRDKLSNFLYDDVDHCLALQTFFELEAGEEKEIIALQAENIRMKDQKN